MWPQERKLFERFVRAVESIAESFKRLVPKKAVSATLIFIDSKGNRIMPATLTIGQTATAKFTEFSGPNGTGVVVAPVGAVGFVSSDPTIATVDASTGLVTAVAAGAATITGTDAGNNISAADSVSDTPLKAQSATLVITPN